MPSGRVLGSKNKASLNIMSEIKKCFTPADCEKVATHLKNHMDNPDPEISLKAIKLFLDKFAISAEKATEAEIMRASVEDREEYERLVKEALEALKG